MLVVFVLDIDEIFVGKGGRNVRELFSQMNYL